MKYIAILLTLGLFFTSCDFGCNNKSEKKDSETKNKKETSEHMIVQKDIYNYFERTGENSIPERLALKVIGPWDENVPFKGDLTIKLPTKLKYTWNKDGEITEYSSKN